MHPFTMNQENEDTPTKADEDGFWWIYFKETKLVANEDTFITHWYQMSLSNAS